MRTATLLAAAATLLVAAAPALAWAAPPKHAAAASPAPQPDAAAGDPTASDMRCFVVAGALLGSDDEQLKSMGRASLFYYIGRLQGRGDTANMSARIVAEYARMTDDDVKAQAKTCSAQFTAATQALQDLSDALQKHFGGQGAAPGAAAPK